MKIFFYRGLSRNLCSWKIIIRFPLAKMLFQANMKIEFNFNVSWITYHYKSKQFKKWKILNFHNSDLWCGLKQLKVLPRPLRWYFELQLRQETYLSEVTYLHKCLCSKIKKNADPGRGVAKCYKSEYPLTFEKKCALNDIHSKISKYIVHLSFRTQEMSEEHCLKKWNSLNEVFKSYEPTRAGITSKTQK